MHITYDLPVTIEDIQDARKRLAGKIYKTGMPRSNYLSERCKGEIFLKFENMQRTGSFKIRGACISICWAMRQISTSCPRGCTSCGRK